MYLIRGFTECFSSSLLHILICYCITQHIQSNKSHRWFYSIISSSHTLHLSLIHSFVLSNQVIQYLVFMIHRKETSPMDKAFGVVNSVCYNLIVPFIIIISLFEFMSTLSFYAILTYSFSTFF